MCFAIRKPKVKAGSRYAIDVLPDNYTPIATPTKGANAIKGIPKLQPMLASITAEPSSNTTKMNVPIISTKSFF